MVTHSLVLLGGWFYSRYRAGLPGLWFLIQLPDLDLFLLSEWGTGSGLEKLRAAKWVFPDIGLSSSVLQLAPA